MSGIRWLCFIFPHLYDTYWRTDDVTYRQCRHCGRVKLLGRLDMQPVFVTAPLPLRKVPLVPPLSHRLVKSLKNKGGPTSARSGKSV
jgi:hypothetical protein